MTYYLPETVPLPEEYKSQFPLYDSLTAKVNPINAGGEVVGTIEVYLVPKHGSKLRLVGSANIGCLTVEYFERGAIDYLKNQEEMKKMLSNPLPENPLK